jgi:uncharacterized protein
MSLTNKDRPSTWVTYRNELCASCKGSCCTMPVEVKASDLLRLNLISEDEINSSIKKTAKKLKKQGIINSYREGTDVFMISQKSNDDCYFLDSKTRLCTVYENRPDTCRDFPLKVGPRVKYCPYSKKDILK